MHASGPPVAPPRRAGRGTRSCVRQRPARIRPHDARVQAGAQDPEPTTPSARPRTQDPEPVTRSLRDTLPSRASRLHPYGSRATSGAPRSRCLRAAAAPRPHESCRREDRQTLASTRPCAAACPGADARASSASALSTRARPRRPRPRPSIAAVASRAAGVWIPPQRATPHSASWRLGLASVTDLRSDVPHVGVVRSYAQRPRPAFGCNDRPYGRHHACAVLHTKTATHTPLASSRPRYATRDARRFASSSRKTQTSPRREKLTHRLVNRREPVAVPTPTLEYTDTDHAAGRPDELTA